MSNWFFDYDSGDVGLEMSDSLGMSSNGDMLMRMGDNLAMDMETGDLRMFSGWSNHGLNSNLFDGDDDD